MNSRCTACLHEGQRARTRRSRGAGGLEEESRREFLCEEEEEVDDVSAEPSPALAHSLAAPLDRGARPITTL